MSAPEGVGAPGTSGPSGSPDSAALRAVEAAQLPAAAAANGPRPFVNTLRARPATLRVGDGAAPTITVRVQMPEVWDAVRVELPAAEPVLSLKTAALQALYPEARYHDDYVLKLGGFEVLDEGASVAEAGARDGSTFLLTHRRRRPVR